MDQKEELAPFKQVLVATGDEHKSYFFLENGIVVKESHMKIENGKEIPCDKEEFPKYFIEIPKENKNLESITLYNSKTKEPVNKFIKHKVKKDEVCFIKVFNKTKNIGEIHKIINGIDAEIKYYKIENGKEIFCEEPKNNKKKFFTKIPKKLNNDKVSVYDKEHNFIKNIPNKICAQIDSQTEICLLQNEAEKIEDMRKKISLLTEEVKKKLKTSIEKSEETITTLEGKKSSTTTYSEVERAIDAILSNKEELFHEDFYKSINSSEEFGISRFVADRFYHLPKLLSNPELTKQSNTTTYIVNSKAYDSQGNGICLEHRFQATSSEEATKLAKLIIKRLQGIQHKIWMATWRLANELGKYTYTCALTELMRLSYPDREAYFQTKEKIEFYEHLKSLENTKIIFTKKRKKSSNSKKIREDFIEIRALEILKGTRNSGEKYPEYITLTVLNTSSLQNEKMAFMGAGYKHKTLELHADDILFAQTIQTRLNQNYESKEMKVDRDYLIEKANLIKTDKSNKTHANKLLIEKLKRLKEKGILRDVPQRIREKVILKGV